MSIAAIDRPAALTRGSDVKQAPMVGDAGRVVRLRPLGDVMTLQKLSTAGAWGFLLQRLKTPLIVMNGNLLNAANFNSMLEFHVEHRATATMAMRERTVETMRHSCIINASAYQPTFEVLSVPAQASNDNVAESATQGCCNLALLKRTTALSLV